MFFSMCLTILYVLYNIKCFCKLVRMLIIHVFVTMLMVEEYDQFWTLHSRSYSCGNVVLGVPANHVLYTIVAPL